MLSWRPVVPGGFLSLLLSFSVHAQAAPGLLRRFVSEFSDLVNYKFRQHSPSPTHQKRKHIHEECRQYAYPYVHMLSWSGGQTHLLSLPEDHRIRSTVGLE